MALRATCVGAAARAGWATNPVATRPTSRAAGRAAAARTCPATSSVAALSARRAAELAAAGVRLIAAVVGAALLQHLLAKRAAAAIIVCTYRNAIASPAAAQKVVGTAFCAAQSGAGGARHLYGQATGSPTQSQGS